jgi:ABC-type molybdate transport system ATPase subunit
VPLVYVTHSPDEARAIADYAIVLDEGKALRQARRERCCRKRKGLRPKTQP